MANSAAVDWDFISSKEGGTKTIGYIPVCTAKSTINPSNRTCFGKPVGSVIGKSGVTIAAGFDLGQLNQQEFKKLNLPVHLNKTLEQFVGKKKQDALDALNGYEKNGNIKLQITGTDAKIINQRLKEKTLHTLMSNYDKKSSKNFLSLDADVQTALASFAFQYGPNFYAHKAEFPRAVWELYVKQDYTALVEKLEKAPEYKERRKEEAALIKKLL